MEENRSAHTFTATPTNETLYRQQLAMLRGFLERGAISQAQFDRSAGELTRKMQEKH